MIVHTIHYVVILFFVKFHYKITSKVIHVSIDPTIIYYSAYAHASHAKSSGGRVRWI